MQFSQYFCLSLLWHIFYSFDDVIKIFKNESDKIIKSCFRATGF